MISKFLKWVFGSSCEHKWLMEDNSFSYMDAWERKPKRKFFLACKKCGEMKVKDL